MNITVLSYRYDDGSYDTAVDHVAEALRAGGHKASPLLVPADLKAMMTGLARRKPDLVFHMITEFGDINGCHITTAGILDALRLSYTGGGPGGLFLRGHKTLAKKILAYEKLNCPDFAVFSLDANLETGGNLRLPMIVKPVERDCSVGIGRKSLVHNTAEMLERVRFIHREVEDDALVEEYVEGREFHVGVLGNRDRIAFPPIELDFSGLPDDAPHILDYKAKWEEDSAEFKGTRAVVPDLPDELKARLQEVAVKACRALLISDFARVDLRLKDTGDIYVIEVNTPCDLDPTGEFATGARAGGLEYPALINRIAELAAERYGLSYPGANGRAKTRKKKVTSDR
jgi:D-alanine-D-alanine ligase